jgi:hypothetical protein
MVLNKKFADLLTRHNQGAVYCICLLYKVSRKNEIAMFQIFTQLAVSIGNLIWEMSLDTKTIKICL